jgi:hypothetical protein
MEPANGLRVSETGLQLDKNAADLLDILVLPDEVLVAKQVTKAEFAGFALGLGTGVKRAKFGPQLFG